MTPTIGLDRGTPWDKSLLRNTRCPFLRAAASAGDLDIVNGENRQGKHVLLATVASVRKAGDRLADVLAFFARFNHTRGLKGVNDVDVFQRFRQDRFNMDQSNDLENISDGTHDGSVDIISGPPSSFNPAVVAVIRGIAVGPVLTPQGMAQVIIKANQGAFSNVSGNSPGNPVDLAKSAGEWALMFCLLQDDHGNVPIDDLEKLCKDEVIPPRGQANLAKSSTREWIQYTAVITAHIAQHHIAHGQPKLADEVGHEMHTVWCEEKNGPGCGCAVCTQGKAGFWQNPGPSIRNAIATFGGGLGRWFKF